MILLTGFPGFLGTYLIDRLLQHCSSEQYIVCLVQDKFLALAKDKLQERPTWKDRVQLIVGDICHENLGLPIEWNQRVEQIFHLAAIYDLSVDRDLATLINVDGTKNVVRFAENSPNFKRLDYISTCYVSGRFPGHFFESDLEKGQTFNNFYEETKYLAEVEVQKAMQNGLPAAIYRPGIIVGDSKTGWTQKFDGPYYILQWLNRQKGVAVLPELGDYKKICVNLVPVDFVAEAIAKLSLHSLSLNKVYHLADPSAPPIDRFLEYAERTIKKRILTLPFPSHLTKMALGLRPLQKWTRINPDTIDYFTHPTIYDTTNASRDLEILQVPCPKLEDYLPNLLAYMRSVRAHNTKAMV